MCHFWDKMAFELFLLELQKFIHGSVQRLANELAEIEPVRTQSSKEGNIQITSNQQDDQQKKNQYDTTPFSPLGNLRQGLGTCTGGKGVGVMGGGNRPLFHRENSYNLQKRLKLLKKNIFLTQKSLVDIYYLEREQIEDCKNELKKGQYFLTFSIGRISSYLKAH